MQDLDATGRLDISNIDYRKVELQDGDIVYCDIPYKGTQAKYCNGFDYDAFYDWCHRQSVPLYISEYAMPEDRFECVAEITRCGHLCATNNANYKVEKLFKVKRND